VRPIFFSSPQGFYDWLEEHHETEQEVYVGYWKKATGKPSLTWSEAVDQALCFGWIDGRLNRIDDERHMQRFTPRRANSKWSKVNVAKVEQLKAAGRMRPSGLAAFERRTEADYSFERDRAELPPELERRLHAHRAASEWFGSQPPGYRKSATHWVVSAKREETRLRRLQQLIDCSAEGRPVPPLTRPEARR
jgi:uncharacterized protein YdeI (YjbR/CyaY-like superfamily)